MYNHREYLILPSTEVPKIDFSQVCETSANTLRFSVDSTKTFIKWDGETPAFVADLVDTEGPYTHAEILTILATEEWTQPTNEESV